MASSSKCFASRVALEIKSVIPPKYFFSTEKLMAQTLEMLNSFSMAMQTVLFKLPFTKS